jgi:DNA-binding transcriptional LysR family regulator
MRTLDLDSLEIFRTVVTEGGVIRAAEKLNRVQSNVTTRVRQLEERLGVRLFRRKGRALEPSPEGMVLLQYADRLLRLADEAQGVLQSGRPRGVFRLGSLESTAGSRLPSLLSRYHLEYPEVTVELVTGTTGALLRRMAAFEIEAAFVSEPFTAPDLNSRVMFDEELVLVSAKSHKKIRTAADLGAVTLVAFASGCSYRQRLQEWIGLAGVLPARVLEFSSYQAMLACVSAGSGVAIVPRSLLEALRAMDDVQLHPLPEAVRRNHTHLVWHGTPSLALERLMAMPAAARTATSPIVPRKPATQAVRRAA